MRWIIIPVLWIAAIVVALIVFRRLRRGKHVVLTGRFSPRLVRMIAVILVLFGVGGERTENKANAYPLTPLKDNPHDQMPTLPVSYWLHHQSPSSTWGSFKKSMTSALLKGSVGDAEAAALTKLSHVFSNSKSFSVVFNADLQALKKGQELPRVSPKEALAALDLMERYGFYDHWLNAYLWRKTATDDPKSAKELSELYRRFQQHARVTDALIAAFAQVRPPMQAPRAWASKAGPRPHELEMIKAFQKSQQDVLTTATKLYPSTDEGTWKRDGLILLSPVKDSPAPNLIRAGKLKGFPEGEKTRVGRLDLIETPNDSAAVLEHEWLGKIELPKNRIVSVWDLPRFISKDGEDKLRAAIKKALDGDEKAADQLEKVLPLAHLELRAALKETPKAKGAPRLRMILSLFDDAIMPQLKEPQVGERPGAFDNGGFGGGGFGGGGFGGGPGGGGFRGGGRVPIPDDRPPRR